MERFIECGAHKDGYFIRNKFMVEADIPSFIKEYNNLGVYYTPYSYESEDPYNSNLLSDLYIDMDAEDNFELIRKEVKKIIGYLNIIFKINHNELKLYFSGSKGLHIIIPYQVFGIEPISNLNEVFKLIVLDIIKTCKVTTVDTKIYDKRRLFRIPNSIHQKTNLYKIPLSYKEIMELSFDEIKELASAPREEILLTPKKKLDAASEYKRYVTQANVVIHKSGVKAEYKLSNYVPPCIKKLLEEEVSSGGRNDSLALLASHWMQNAYTLEETLDLARRWNENVVVPPIEDFELDATIKSVYAGNHTFGCGKAKDVSVCTKSECKFGKNQW